MTEKLDSMKDEITTKFDNVYNVKKDFENKKDRLNLEKKELLEYKDKLANDVYISNIFKYLLHFL